MISYPQDIGGTMTRVLHSGTEGETIVLVHGTGGRADRWSRNIDALAEAGYRVYAIDLPGHGLAAKSGDFDHSVPGYAAFIAGFLKTLDDSVTLVGTSLGGHAVARCALDNPGLVKRLVLVGSMGLVPVGDEAAARIRAGAMNQTREGIEAKLHRVIADPALVTQTFVEEEFMINNSEGAAASFARLGTYVVDRLDKDVVGEALMSLVGRMPTLLVWGEADKTVVPEIGRKAAALLEGAPLVLINGAAHTAYYEKPEAFNAVLADFIEGRTGQTHLPELDYV